MDGKHSLMKMAPINLVLISCGSALIFHLYFAKICVKLMYPINCFAEFHTPLLRTHFGIFLQPSIVLWYKCLFYQLLHNLLRQLSGQRLFE